MTIRIYPSRLPGEPLETHQHGTISLHDWFARNVRGWQFEMTHPITVEVDGEPVPSSEWPLCVIKSDTDVRIFPIAYGLEAATLAWIAVGIAVASVAYSLFMMSNIDSSGYSQAGVGDSLELNPAKANSAKLGDPIREILGRYKVWPDYVVAPVSRFVDKKKYYTSLFLCVGVGEYLIPRSGIKIGSTPVSSFGDDVQYTIYPPGADVSADERSENWYNAPEVGGTNTGNAGLDLASSGPETVSINADAVTVSGTSLSLIRQTSSDDDDTDDSVIPDSWKEGTIIYIRAPNDFIVRTEAGYNVISGPVDELAPTVGMPVTLELNDRDFELYIAGHTPGKEPIPGVGGSPSSITGSAAVSEYDFSTNSVTFTLTWRGTSYVISLDEDYGDIVTIASAISGQLSGSGIRAEHNDAILAIREYANPYAGAAIGYSLLPAELFGTSPVVVTGTASTGGSPEVLAQITLAYDSATGKPFNGIPTGVQRLAIDLRGFRYKITEIDGLTITVARLIDVTALQTDEYGNTTSTTTTEVDQSWPGFTERTMLDASVTGINDDYNWLGPYVVCPDSETTTRFEMNFAFTSGLCSYDNKGRKGGAGVNISVQYRKIGDDEWTDKSLRYSDSSEDAIGFTEVFDVESDAQFEVRVRRTNAPAGGSTRDQVYWQALRSRLSKRPSNYADVTTIALTVRTGNRIAAQSDRRVNVVATRNYDDYPARSISGALHHVMSSLGVTDSEIDIAGINDLESAHWTPRGETFDFSAGESDTSALDILQKITNAGMGYFLLSDGLMSVGREGVKNWTGIISPQETTEELQISFSAPSDDDYDGVDVTYINGTTWAEETVQCRAPDNPTPKKVEDYKLDGVLDPDRAYRIGMRRLQKYLYQRLSHSTSTELDALCYEYMDRIVLTDDIPGSDTISCLIVAISYDGTTITLTVSEPLDWTFNNPRVLIRQQDGSASALLTPTRIDDYSLTIPYSEALHPEDWIMEDPSIEPPRLIFFSSERVGYDAIIDSIDPDSDGTCGIEAKQYSPIFYQYDDAIYPGDVQ